MQLTFTGFVVRAAQYARLHGAVHRNVNRAHPLCRTAATQTVRKDEPSFKAAFTLPSISKPNEVDPKKTAAGHKETSKEALEKDVVRTFKQALINGKVQNKIIHEYGHSGILVHSDPWVFDETSNLSPAIAECIDRRLYDDPNHPIGITRALIEDVFGGRFFANHTVINPIVTSHDNFDVLGFPEDHPGRSRTDTYYVDSKHVLRTHTSAHQHAAFRRMVDYPERGYTICADVYRRDSIDRSHFPVFHQMEGAKVWKLNSPPKVVEKRYEARMDRRYAIQDSIKRMPKRGLEVEQCPALDQTRNPVQIHHDHDDVRLMVGHLKASLETLVDRVFTAAREAGVSTGDTDSPLKVRWVEAYFPFTSPSFELEVFWQGEWLELLGCGIVQQKILNNAEIPDAIGWAWGLGIERLAMILFGIPDIRLFWSRDERFLSQFKAGKITKFEPFSKYPACYKDVAFWINAIPAAASPLAATIDGSSGVAAAAGGDATKASPTETQPAAFHENDVMELVRDVAGSLVEDVRLVDEFVHPTTGRKSLCYRVNYRSLERTLTNEEVNDLHGKFVTRLAQDLGVELRG